MYRTWVDTLYVLVRCIFCFSAFSAFLLLCIFYFSAKPQPRVEQAADPKMHVLSGALVMKALLVLNKHSAVAHEVGGHRTPP